MPSRPVSQPAPPVDVCVRGTGFTKRATERDTAKRFTIFCTDVPSRAPRAPLMSSKREHSPKTALETRAPVLQAPRCPCTCTKRPVTTFRTSLPRPCTGKPGASLTVRKMTFSHCQRHRLRPTMARLPPRPCLLDGRPWDAISTKTLGPLATRWARAVS